MAQNVKCLSEYEPLQYQPILKQIEAILNQQLSLDMLSSAEMLSSTDAYTEFAEKFKKQAFPETERGTVDKTSSKYYLPELKSSEGKVTFKENCFLEVELSKEDGLFFFQNYKFNIFGHGLTKEEALKDFYEFFVHDYLSYKNTPPNNLTRDACQLLKEYESVIAQFESL